MRKPIKWDDPPNLAVIDEAIKLIELGLTTYTCTALSEAARNVEQCADPRVRASIYQRQYRRLILGPAGCRPYWWNSPRGYYMYERIAALNKFRRACIDAAKKEN